MRNERTVTFAARRGKVSLLARVVIGLLDDFEAAQCAPREPKK